MDLKGYNFYYPKPSPGVLGGGGVFVNEVKKEPFSIIFLKDTGNVF